MTDWDDWDDDSHPNDPPPWAWMANVVAFLLGGFLAWLLWHLVI